jgi:hypothetical protein
VRVPLREAGRADSYRRCQVIADKKVLPDRFRTSLPLRLPERRPGLCVQFRLELDAGDTGVASPASCRDAEAGYP